MNNIWIINHYASLKKGRLPEIASVFVQFGYSVSIFLSSFSHGNKKYMYDDEVKIVKVDGVNYVYIHSGPMYNNNGSKRILNMLDFCRIIKKNHRYIANEIGKPDSVIASSVHPFAWEIGYALSKKYKSSFVAEVRDIWPLSLIELLHLSRFHPLVVILSVIEKRAYRRADAIVTTMPFAYRHICDTMGYNKNKVHWIPNGIDTKRADEAVKNGIQLPPELDAYLTNHWCCIYTGSFVESERVDFMVKAFDKLKDTDIHFAIVGSGQDKHLIENLICEKKLENIEVFDPISKDQVHVALDKAQCCLAAIHDYPIYNYGLSMNKLSDYLYSGKPVIFACDCENVVMDAGHVVVSSQDEDAFVNAIIDVRNNRNKEYYTKLGETSKTLIKEKYDYQVIARNYVELLKSL